MDNFYKKILEDIEEKGNLRKLVNTCQTGSFITVNGKQYLNFSSNDYLGIASDKEIVKKFFIQIKNTDHLFGTPSSRLLTGNHPAYEKLESLMTDLFRKEACLVYNSGYHANIGILPALAGKKDMILADKFVHASIIDGIKLAGCDFFRYKHLDFSHLESYLKKYRSKYDKVFVVTESVFSMDGDLADLPALVELKKKYDFAIYLDEAHAFGVFGKSGLGLAEQMNCIGDMDLLMGTFGKAAASQGAFVVCSKVIKEFLVNHSRSLIFTTALPQVNVMWTEYILRLILNMQHKRDHLFSLVGYFKKALEESGKNSTSCSQIIPYIVGENKNCIALSEKLKSAGFWCMPVRYPTVPAGTARIRFSLSATMTFDILNNLIAELQSMQK
ncbi:MAG: 8-amino-7-oxononanoate synthase [Bacteroidia bacterium]|nr:8-amino-7-oxononanoate synthase [Bacteroidia bacterium]